MRFSKLLMNYFVAPSLLGDTCMMGIDTTVFENQKLFSKGS